MRFSRFSLGIATALIAASMVPGTTGCNDQDTTAQTGGAGGSGAGGSGAGGTGGGTGGSETPAGPQIPGLTSKVDAIYDQAGLLHLSCANDEDCFAALGYFHASNRFFFMDFVRNLVRGKLASLVKGGDTVLQQDFANRRWFATSTGEPLAEKLYSDASAETKTLMDAYTRGVNAWLGDMRAKKNGATLTTEYDFALIVKDAIRDWEPADSAAIGLYVLDDLSNNSDTELALAKSLPAYDPALAADLFSPQPVFDAFTKPLAPPAPPKAPGGAWNDFKTLGPLFDAARDSLSQAGSGVHWRHPGDTGSNNWAVGPSRTASGNAILANDPHLPLSNPSIWFPVEIDSTSGGGTGNYHMAGSSFPGLPAVMVGRNENIGWGVTTAFWDLADVYVEKLSADGKSVIFNGEEVAIIEKELEFDDVASGGKVKQSFKWVPHHGPILSEDMAAGTAISVRWRGHEGGTDLDAFLGLGRAADIAAGKKAIESASSASQNFVVVDKAGEIGWFPYSKVPKRAWASESVPPWLPLPGDGTAEWDSFVPFADLPQLLNPADGVIATANADMTGACADGDLLNDGQAALQSYFKADGTREQRILDQLAAGGDTHSMETMTALHGDDFSLYGEFATPVILEELLGVALSPDEQAVFDALTAWKYTCPTGLDGSDPATAADSADADEAAESIGCTAFHAVFYSLLNQAMGDETAAAGESAIGQDLIMVARALRDPAEISSGEMFWDDVSTPNVTETRKDIVVRAVSFAATRLAVNGAPNAWRWGRLHTLSLRSIFDNFGFTTYNVPPVAAPGGLFTVNVASPRRVLPAEDKPWSFDFRSGPSVRFVVEAAADGLKMSYQLPGGSDLHRESQFYNNLFPNWLENKPVDFPFGPGAVTDPAVEVTVTPLPE